MNDNDTEMVIKTSPNEQLVSEIRELTEQIIKLKESIYSINCGGNILMLPPQELE